MGTVPFGSKKKEKDGTEVKRGEAFNTGAFPHVVFLSFGDEPAHTYRIPDRKDTVIRVELKKS